MSVDDVTDLIDSEELWLLNLQELLERLQPETRELGSLTLIEDFLSSLESTDPNFHRYNFVCQIRDQLDLELSPLISNAISESREDTLVSDISNKLLSSNEYQNISSTINYSVKNAAETITQHLNSDTFDFSEHTRKFEKDGEYFNPSASVCSTTDGMEFMFMSPDRYKVLAKDINTNKSVANRLKALSILQQVPQTDLVASDAWSLTRKGLLKALDDENDEVNCKALKFISNLFVSGSSHVIREYFLLLVENLIEFFTDGTSHVIFLESGLDLGDKRNLLLMKKFRLLNDVQKELPATWLRYSEKYVEEMIDNTISLLEISPSSPLASATNKALMNPLQFLSLVDPQASWFKMWMHGFYGRSNVISALALHRSCIRKTFKSCIDMCKRLHNYKLPGPNVQERGEELIYSFNDITYTHFLHSLNFLSYLVLYKDGRSLLHFDLQNGKTINVEILLLAFVDIMKTYPSIPYSSSKSMYHAGFLISQLFHTLANADLNTVTSCLCFDKLYEPLIQSLLNVLKEPESKMKESSLNFVVGVLAEIAVSNIGCQQLLKERDIPEYVEKKSILDIVIAVFIENEQAAHIPSSVLLNLLFLCQRVLRSTEGLFALRTCDFHLFLRHCLKEQKLKTGALLDNMKCHSEQTELLSPLSPSSGSGSGSSRKESDNLAYRKSLQIEKQLYNTIFHLALTPKGLALALQSGYLDSCVLYIYHKYQSKKDFTKTAKNGCGILFNHIASTTSGIKALSKCGM